MGNKNKFYSTDTAKKEFLKIFKELCYSRQPWEVWSDVITIMACSIANATDREPKRYESREREYAECIKRLKEVDKAAQLLAIVINTLESNPNQDFLGSLYMQLELGNHWKSQYFTEYNISQLLAEITLGNCQERIDREGWISVCDPTVGGGSMLISAANLIRYQKINYQTHVFFVGQDIDRIVGMMAYIQISLLGCPGYIVIADSLMNPIKGNLLMPVAQAEQEFWYTPLYFSQIWHYRRIFVKMDNIFKNTEREQVKSIPLRGGFLFEFEEEIKLAVI